MRHLLQPYPTDRKGTVVPGVAYTVYNADLAAASISQDGQAQWVVNESTLPAPIPVYGSAVLSDTTAITMVSGVGGNNDGQSIVGYVPSGIYAVIGKISTGVGDRFFVVPRYEAGTTITVAMGSTVAAGDDLETALSALVTSVENLQTAAANATDSNVFVINKLADDAPAAGTIPAEVAALTSADQIDDLPKVEFKDMSIWYKRNTGDTAWEEDIRVPRDQVAADPASMTFRT